MLIQQWMCCMSVVERLQARVHIHMALFGFFVMVSYSSVVLVYYSTRTDGTLQIYFRMLDSSHEFFYFKLSEYSDYLCYTTYETQFGGKV